LKALGVAALAPSNSWLSKTNPISSRVGSPVRRELDLAEAVRTLARDVVRIGQRRQLGAEVIRQHVAEHVHERERVGQDAVTARREIRRGERAESFLQEPRRSGLRVLVVPDVREARAMVAEGSG
jgi:hypothetical protein